MEEVKVNTIRMGDGNFKFTERLGASGNQPPRSAGTASEVQLFCLQYDRWRNYVQHHEHAALPLVAYLPCWLSYRSQINGRADVQLQFSGGQKIDRNAQSLYTFPYHPRRNVCARVQCCTLASALQMESLLLPRISGSAMYVECLAASVI